MRFAKPMTRAVLCAGAVVLTATGCGGGDKNGGDNDGGVAGGDVAASSSVTAAGNTGESGYVGDIQPIAMRTFNGDRQQAVAGRQAFIK